MLPTEASTSFLRWFGFGSPRIPRLIAGIYSVRRFVWLESASSYSAQEDSESSCLLDSVPKTPITRGGVRAGPVRQKASPLWNARLDRSYNQGHIPARPLALPQGLAHQYEWSVILSNAFFAHRLHF